jgi:hypothetical protein
MKTPITTKLLMVLVAMLLSTSGLTAYYHMGENDSGNFLAAYPDLAGTKVDLHRRLTIQSGTMATLPEWRR